MDKSLWFIFNHKDSKKAATVAAQVSMVVHAVGHRRRFTPIIADGGPVDGPPSAHLTRSNHQPAPPIGLDEGFRMGHDDRIDLLVGDGLAIAAHIEPPLVDCAGDLLRLHAVTGRGEEVNDGFGEGHGLCFFTKVGRKNYSRPSCGFKKTQPFGLTSCELI